MKALLFAVAALGSGLLAEPVSFNRDIRPIMADTCFRCHGPDKSSRMANLRLDLRDEALKPNRRGLAPIVPGNPEQSHIIQRIFATEPARGMPPASAHKTLTAAQKDAIRRWVAEGAKYEGHWAYEPIRRPAVPGILGLSPVDAFIRAQLAKEGLTPAPEADRRTLIRRVALDLTGIPPTPEDVDAFVADRSGNAYEKLVDRLMASTRYAEQQAMHWLDAVRYADTAGFHGDNPFPAWPYRDYVLQSIHQNKPFDVFTREQLAGDLLRGPDREAKEGDLLPWATLKDSPGLNAGRRSPGPNREQLTASAFNRILRVSAEGGLQPKEYLAKYGADRVRTIAAVWMGSTLGCAECHDHKFDPFLAKDFYAMKAFFADVKETGLVPDRGPTAWGSQLALSAPAQRNQFDRLQFFASQQELGKARLIASNGIELVTKLTPADTQWRFQRPVSASARNGAKLTIYNDETVPANIYAGPSLVSEKRPGNGLVIASGPNPDNETYTLELRPGAGSWLQLGLQVVQDDSLPGLRLARGSDRLMITEIDAELLPEGRKLRFLTALGSIRQLPFDQHPLQAIDGDPSTGWGGSPYNDSLLPFLALRLERSLNTTADSRIRVTIRQDSEHRKATLGRFRLALSTGPAMPLMDKADTKLVSLTAGLPAQVLAVLKKPISKRSAEETELLEVATDWTTPELTKQYLNVQKAEMKRQQVEAQIPRVMITEALNPVPETRLLRRGNFMDESGPVVEPAIPEFLGKLPVEGRATRLDLANWLVSKDNPLTARAYVNRQWRLFFGTGLSRVLEDLGSQGEWPVHMELMDWLAAEFMDSGWDMKRIVKTIVMSETYRQSSAVTTEKDPENRLLSRQNRFRVEAETVRDIALSVSGLLAERFGGPSAKPYQPEGYLAALNFPKREYSASRGAGLYRRGVYTFWQRSFLHPSLMTFDAATREECTVNRSTSNTPLQALVLLNDPTYVEAARVFAEQTVAEASTAEARVGWAFGRAMGRAPTAAEASILVELYRKNLSRFDAAPAEARALIAAGEAPRTVVGKDEEVAAAMTMTRAILNLHELITRN